jgi:hypothetical protein
MKRLSVILALISLSLLVTGGSCQKDKVRTASAGDISITRVLYKSWQGTIDVDLVALNLKRSGIEYTYPSMVSGNPSSSKTLKYPGQIINQEDAKRIVALIRKSGFLSLKDVYGAPEGHRYYPYRITVYLSNGKSKSTLFRSNPDYGDTPEAFKKLESLLKSLPRSEKPDKKYSECPVP